MIIGNRPVIVTGAPRAQAPDIIRGRKRQDPIDQPHVEEPYEKQFLSKAIGSIHDQDGIHYRVYKFLDPRAGWCTAQQLMDEFEVPFEALVDWCLIGHIDPGVEQGSPSRRFRVKDTGSLRKVAARWHEEDKRRAEREAAAIPKTRMIRGRGWL